MMMRIAVAAAILGLGAFMLWHPAPRAPIASTSSLPPTIDSARGADSIGHVRHRRSNSDAAGNELVVYVAGAVRRPGLYDLRPGDRAAKAVALAGGFSAGADTAGVNLAQRAGDGDEIFVPIAGQTLHGHVGERRGRRHSSTPPPDGSVDVNHAAAAELSAVPGIGRAIAARIVELRAREGSFASLDELLDVAGMTQTRLDRARPYLREL